MAEFVKRGFFLCDGCNEDPSRTFNPNLCLITEKSWGDFVGKEFCQECSDLINRGQRIVCSYNCKVHEHKKSALCSECQNHQLKTINPTIEKIEKYFSLLERTTGKKRLKKCYYINPDYLVIEYIKDYVSNDRFFPDSQGNFIGNEDPSLKDTSGEETTLSEIVPLAKNQLDRIKKSLNITDNTSDSYIDTASSREELLTRFNQLVETYHNPAKKYGSDYNQLKPVQQDGRKATDNSWKKSCQDQQIRSCLICPYCQEEFNYDKNITDYLPASEEVQQRLDDHKNSCPCKDNKEEQKSKRQESWDKFRKEVKETGKGMEYYVCEKCWGKIVADIDIENAELADKQNWADLLQHEKECHKLESERMIAVYHSPNKGGHKHANINDFTYEDMGTRPLSFNNSKHDYQHYQNNEDKKPPFNWTPWLIGGSILAVALLVGVIIYRSKKRK